VLPEPLLEFGDAGRHVDPRVGLIEYGPLQEGEYKASYLGIGFYRDVRSTSADQHGADV
jgi:hypothetical protein